MNRLFILMVAIALFAVVGCQPTVVQPPAQQPNINIQMERQRQAAPAPQYVPVVPVYPAPRQGLLNIEVNPRRQAPPPAPVCPPKNGGGVHISGGIGIDINKNK